MGMWNQTVNRRRFRALSAAACVCLSQTVVHATSVNVPAQANLWAAGLAVAPAPGGGGAGILPVQIQLPPGHGRVVRFTSVTGTVQFSNASGMVGPEGATVACGGFVSFNGISGMTIDRARFLSGVFLSAAPPIMPGPSQQNYIGQLDAPLNGPRLQQSFFIGDGLTGDGSGAVVAYRIPDGATRMFLGFFDACFCLDQPGWFGDNTGSLSVTFEFDSACPGDFNGDGLLDGDDVQAVVQCATAGFTPTCTSCECGDMDADGLGVNSDNDDLALFVTALLNADGCP